MRVINPAFRKKPLLVKNNLKLYFRQPLERQCIFKARIKRAFWELQRYALPTQKKTEGASAALFTYASCHWLEKVPHRHIIKETVVLQQWKLTPINHLSRVGNPPNICRLPLVKGQNPLQGISLIVNDGV